MAHRPERQPRLSPSKLAELSVRSLARYCRVVIHEAGNSESVARSDKLWDAVKALVSHSEVPRGVQRGAIQFQNSPTEYNRANLAGLIEDLSEMFGRTRPTEPSEPDRMRAVKRFPIVVFCDHVRSPYNIGAIIRSAEAMGALGVVVSQDAPDLDHPRLLRAAMGCEQWLTIRRGTASEAVSWVGGVPVVLETGGSPIDTVSFPDRGTLIVGNEELGVSPETRRLIHEHCGMTVSIPMWGKKTSVNVSVAAGIGLHAWTSFLIRR